MTRVLIADDNPQNLYLLEAVLKGHGLAVTSVTNGAEALSSAKNDPPDLIVTDILMPVMDGFELCRKWKADERLLRIPFIFYTATYTDARDEQLATSLGAERFLIKPMKPEALMQAINEVLGESRHKKPLGEEMEVLRQYNETLFHKLEKKVTDLKAEIAERRRTEARLLQSEMRYRNLYESMRDAFIRVDMAGRILEYNHTFREMLGYSDAELARLTYQELTPEKWHAFETSLVETQVVPRGYSEVYEKEYRRKDGTVFPVELRAALVRDDTGRPQGMWALVRDITERKQAEKAIRENAKRLQEAQEMAHLGFWSWDVKTGGVEWSDEVFRIFGLDPGTFTPQIDSILALSPWPEEQERDKELIRRASESRQPGTYEQRFLRPDKSIGYYHSTFEGRYDDEGNLVSIVGTVLDITERRRADEKIRLANRKLALMNEVTSQDIKNKVTGLRGYVELSKKAAGEADRLSYIEKEEEVLRTIHDLIANTEEYQQMGVDHSRWIPVQEIVGDQMSALSMKHSVRLDCDVSGLEIHADPLIGRVFYNLLHNAVRHGRHVTRIAVTCRETPDGLVLSCEDNGIGIPADMKSRIFERIPGGEGKFGLFFVREFLTLSGMSIAETGTPGRGARFDIAIPRDLYRFAGRK